MQQPINQQDQLGCQQAMQQQMVLCPVRFVYETQILVPPGDQIQPNQTFFINPQNPPPWVQNRQIQNQVVYVQQLPNNLLPSTQQHMDQNQLYLQQNFANYQIQQPMLAQNQEIRNLNMTPNMVHTERNIGQSLPNTNQIQHANAQMIQNQINISRQMPNQMNQTMEVQRPYMRPQMTQQTITRPIMTMNQIQNVPMQQAFANMPNVVQQVSYSQSVAPNVGQPRPVTQSMQRSVPNTANVQPVAKVRDATPIDANKIMNNNITNALPITPIAAINNQAANARNFLPNYAYRPIQPRPQVRHSSTQIQLKPVQNSPMYVAKNTPHNVPNNLYIGANNNNVNRKRKSESPDEIQKKMAIAKPNYNALAQSITVTKLSNEIGINTSPVHRIDHKNMIPNNAMLQINPNGAQIVKITNNDQKVDVNAVNTADNTNMSGPSTEKDKLTRNTVYTQARGRVHHDKSTTSNDMTSQTTETDLKPEILTPVVVKTTENEMQSKVTAEIKPAVTVIPENNAEINKNEDDNKPAVSQVISMAVKEEKDVNNDSSEVDNEKIDDYDKIILKQDRDSILTHVLDGYVIQESSFAFPIRKPLKEKTLITNTQDDEQTNNIKEEKAPIDLPLLPFHYLHLNNERLQDTDDKKDENDDQGNPFSQLQYTTVKSWTVENLAKYLAKFDWKETVSIFQDHEIDGESLFLVSKSQLLTIGVNENHADLICEFVKS